MLCSHELGKLQHGILLVRFELMNVPNPMPWQPRAWLCANYSASLLSIWSYVILVSFQLILFVKVKRTEVIQRDWIRNKISSQNYFIVDTQCHTESATWTLFVALAISGEEEGTLLIKRHTRKKPLYSSYSERCLLRHR